MKFNFIKLTILCCIALVSNNVFAQKDFQGKAYYQSKTDVDMSRFDRPDMSEDAKKRIAERMKNMYEKTYVLTFNKEESIYKEEEKLEAPSQDERSSRFASMMSSFAPGLQYKNVKEAVLLQDQEFFWEAVFNKRPIREIRVGNEWRDQTNW